MNSFFVLWLPATEESLAQFWLSAPDRELIAAAADFIDAALRRDPLSQGESRENENDRIMYVFPLGVRFEVQEADRRVTVWSVWRYDQ